MSQLELAERSGLRQSHISQLETGARSNPQAHILIALAKTLDCSTDYLLGLYEREEQTRAS
jgi:transcriptional regulator with XRE-family HTH domain